MEKEQCYVIKFFADEHIPAVEITSHPRNHYRDEALSRTQVCFWIKKERRGEQTSAPL
jgi:hypothetical protein